MFMPYLTGGGQVAHVLPEAAVAADRDHLPTLEARVVFLGRGAPGARSLAG